MSNITKSHILSMLLRSSQICRNSTINNGQTTGHMTYRSLDQQDLGKICIWRLATLVLVLTPTRAFAAGSTGALPWDGPLQTLAADLTGPVATSISVIALFVAGAVLVFGEDLGHFARRALVAVIAIAFLLLGSQFLIALGLTNG